MNSEYKEKLKNKLSEIFHLEDRDLDFGIHKIMNYKRDEINKFINEDLISEINTQLELIIEAEKVKLSLKLENLKQNEFIKEYLEAIEKKDDEATNKLERLKEVKDYKGFQQKLESSSDIIDEVERSIYNPILNFFKRYHKEGDFQSKRQWGVNEKYVVPYNGEEVILLWTHKGQYYVKTTELFKEFEVKIKGLNVKFKVLEVEEDVGNVLASDNKYFVLFHQTPYKVEGYDVYIYFEYRMLDKEEKAAYGKKLNQDIINENSVEFLKKKLNKEKTKELFIEEDGQLRLLKHLKRYTKRNTMDYFIHPNLKAFFEHELDFFIKNEVLFFEDMQKLDQDDLKIHLIRAKSIQTLSYKIIDFLAQIENFQLKLWEKKKFIIKTDYVITLDKINEYAGEKVLKNILKIVIENENQLQEWKDVFKVDITKTVDFIQKREITGIRWKPLPLDTKHFDDSFKWDLLIGLTENNKLDDILDGLLIKSENFQALNLLMNKWGGKVDLIYIDPPFNTGKNNFLYKNDYLDSCWLSMMYNRLDLAQQILTETGSIFVRIDDCGNYYIRFLLDEIFGKSNYRNEIIIKKTQAKRRIDKPFIQQTESLFFYSIGEDYFFNQVELQRENPQWYDLIDYPRSNEYPRTVLGREFYPPKNRRWGLSQERVSNYESKNKVRINNDKTYVDCKGNKVQGKPQIYYDSDPVRNNWLDIQGYSQVHKFPTENSEALLYRIIESGSKEGDTVLDFFLGSGTAVATAHKLNRKWIGIEMGTQFDDFILPRMKEVLKGEKSGISKVIKAKTGGFFKYQYLEQYEDALENIEFTKPQKTLVEFTDYFSIYVLDSESKKNNTLLNIDDMKDPFQYQIKVFENYKSKTVNVDLIEMFNYLLGVFVNRVNKYSDNGRDYIFIIGNLKNKKIVIVWRPIKDIDYEHDKEVIEENLKDISKDILYINGNCIVEGYRPIEVDLKKLIWRE